MTAQETKRPEQNGKGGSQHPVVDARASEKAGTIREAREDDLDSLLRLYAQFHHGDSKPATGAETSQWKHVLAMPEHHVLVAEEAGELVATCAITVIPNVARDARPYAFVENVVADEEHRREGLASACLERACSIAEEAGCYKIVVTTGSHNEAARSLYEKAGFAGNDRRVFVRWLGSEKRR